ncbi:hypothetical protein GIB67_007845 [Kingdonia uniflora]|uniref:mRNA (guanine-N(7))-methyltransferase n=1 Tax=Kingdonia uniflora TaxID=39325 RepID=A0A7J7N2C2_9MAGN|nr:hypothetical protein GIB67_007845 [Kingdonia uniflora]
MSSSKPVKWTYHRLYVFAKTALIKIFVLPYATVCDLYCGNGEDMDKWDEAQIGHYIGIGKFESLLREKSVPADIVCCLQHLQLCFETEERARSLLCNVSAILRLGGYFFGITPDSSTIWYEI